MTRPNRVFTCAALLPLTALAAVAAAAPVQAPPSAGATPQERPDPAASLAAAQQALEQGRFAEAEQQYLAIVRAFPTEETGFLGLAEALMRQNKRIEAAAAAVRAADILLSRGQATEALGIVNSSLALNPIAPSAHRVCGQALITNGQFGEAVRALTRAVNYGDKSLDTQLLLAGALWEAGELERSEAAYRKAVVDSDGAPVALHQLGSLLLWQGRYADAREPLVRAATVSNVPDLELDLGRALEGSGDFDAALAAYDRATIAAPESREAHYAYARLLARTGNREHAQHQMALYRRLYQEDQERNREAKLAEARLERAWKLLTEGNAELAAAEFAQLPATVDALEGLAVALAATGDHAGAVKALEQAVPLAPERRDLQMMLARERLAAEQQR